MYLCIKGKYEANSIFILFYINKYNLFKVCCRRINNKIIFTSSGGDILEISHPRGVIVVM